MYLSANIVQVCKMAASNRERGRPSVVDCVLSQWEMSLMTSSLTGEAGRGLNCPCYSHGCMT